MSPSVEAPRPEPMTVADLMSRALHTTTEAETIRDALATMRMSRIRHLPVLDVDGQLIGIVSDRDIYLGWSGGPSTPISAVMSRNLKWVHPTTTARAAAALLIQRKIGSLPVVDEAQMLVGILTETDFLEVAVRALTFAEAMRLEEAS